MNHKFIYITGCDGTGKTTQTKLLMKQLAEQGVKVRHLWLRFPFFFSLPLLAYSRYRGYSQYEIFGKVRHGYWNFRKSWLMRNIFPWVLLLDASLAALWFIYLPIFLGWTIVCERFVLDILVDLSVAYGDTKVHERLPGRLYLVLLPRASRIIILDLDAELIRERRSDLKLDRRLSERLNNFREIMNSLRYPLLSSRYSIEDVNKTIWDRLSI